MASRRVILAALGAVSLLVAGAVAVGAYDHSRRNRIAHGVRIAGIDVGGLSRDQARARLRRELVRPLLAPVTVRWRGRTWRLTGAAAGLTVDLESALDQALQRSRRGSLLARVSRDLTGGSVHVAIVPAIRFSMPALARFVAGIRQAVARPSVDAGVRFAVDRLGLVPGRDGRALAVRRLRRDLLAALGSSDPALRGFDAVTRRVRPRVGEDGVARHNPVVITVDRAHFVLRLFKDLHLVKTYRIAVGRAGLETPAGTYHITDKQVNPSWHVPKSSWAGALAGRVIPPGPEDPIKARWMGIYNGAGIHGTEDIGSLGSAASHGCIRMAIPDVIELYKQTPYGSAVYVQ